MEGAPGIGLPDAVGAPSSEATAQEVLTWAIQRFRPRVMLSCSFGGPGGMVLAHMLAQCAPDVPVYFIDTGFLFPETYRLRQTFAASYGLQVIDFTPTLTPVEQATQYGDALWETDPDACCRLRKVEPMARALTQVDAWITALRRDQSSTRAGVDLVEEHASQGRTIWKINPLAHWTRRQVWQYLLDHRVPYNPLLDDGYQSIGCMQCTARTASTTDERSGRWQGHAKTECGLHTFTQPSIPATSP